MSDLFQTILASTGNSASASVPNKGLSSEHFVPFANVLHGLENEQVVGNSLIPTTAGATVGSSRGMSLFTASLLTEVDSASHDPSLPALASSAIEPSVANEGKGAAAASGDETANAAVVPSVNGGLTKGPKPSGFLKELPIDRVATTKVMLAEQSPPVERRSEQENTDAAQAHPNRLSKPEYPWRPELRPVDSASTIAANGSLLEMAQPPVSPQAQSFASLPSHTKVTAETLIRGDTSFGEGEASVRTPTYAREIFADQTALPETSGALIKSEGLRASTEGMMPPNAAPTQIAARGDIAGTGETIALKPVQGQPMLQEDSTINPGAELIGGRPVGTPSLSELAGNLKVTTSADRTPLAADPTAHKLAAPPATSPRGSLPQSAIPNMEGATALNLVSAEDAGGASAAKSPDNSALVQPIHGQLAMGNVARAFDGSLTNLNPQLSTTAAQSRAGIEKTVEVSSFARPEAGKQTGVNTTADNFVSMKSKPVALTVTSDVAATLEKQTEITATKLAAIGQTGIIQQNGLAPPIQTQMAAMQAKPPAPPPNRSSAPHGQTTEDVTELAAPKQKPEQRVQGDNAPVAAAVLGAGKVHQEPESSDHYTPPAFPSPAFTPAGQVSSEDRLPLESLQQNSQMAGKSPAELRHSALTQLRSIELGAGRTLVSLVPRGIGGLEIELLGDKDAPVQVTVRVENANLLQALREDRQSMIQALGLGDTTQFAFEQSGENQGNQHQETANTPGDIEAVAGSSQENANTHVDTIHDNAINILT